MEILELLKSRRSTVLFSGKAIDNSDIAGLFEAARWAPSSMNQQPWKFVYVLKDDSQYDSWLECLFDKNREWAQHAPMLILTAAKLKSDYNMKENPYAVHDTALAFSNLVFQALSLQLSVHPMGGFDKERIKKLAGLPEDHEPLVIAAVGFRSDSSDFPDHLLERENSVRKRKAINEIAFRHFYSNNEV